MGILKYRSHIDQTKRDSTTKRKIDKILRGVENKRKSGDYSQPEDSLL